MQSCSPHHAVLTCGCRSLGCRGLGCLAAPRPARQGRPALACPVRCSGRLLRRHASCRVRLCLTVLGLLILKLRVLGHCLKCWAGSAALPAGSPWRWGRCILLRSSGACEGPRRSWQQSARPMSLTSLLCWCSPCSALSIVSCAGSGTPHLLPVLLDTPCTPGSLVRV